MSADWLTGGDWSGLVDGLHEAVIAAGTDDVVLYVNRAAETLLGWDSTDLVGRPLTVIMPERFRERHRVGFARYVDTSEPSVMGRPLRVPAVRRDGTELEVELVLSVAELAFGTVLLGLLRDASERVELEGTGDLADAFVAALTETPALADALPRMLAGVGETLNWDVVQLWLVDDEAMVLRRRAAWVRDASLTGSFTVEQDEFASGVGLPGRVWMSAGPAWIDDVAADPGFPRAAAAAAVGLRAAYAFPVLSDGQVIGVVEMLSGQPHGISVGMARQMTALGARLGSFIARRANEEERLSLLESERVARAEAEDARSRLAFLADASTVLSEGLDLDVTLDRVASLAVPALGDWCVIHLVNGDKVEVAAVSHSDDSKVRLLRLAHDLYPVSLAAAGGVGKVIRDGDMVRHDRVSDDVLRAVARDEQHLSLLRQFDFGSLVTVPLQSRNRRLGAITLASDTRVLTDDTVNTVVELSRRAAVAIDNAQLYRNLQLQTAMMRTLGEAGVEGHVIVSPDRAILSFNHRFAEMWSLSDEVLAARSDERALAAASEQLDDPGRFRARIEQVYATRSPARDELTLRDGRVFDRVGAPLFDEGIYLGYGWYFRDVTTHKRIENNLARAAATSAALARTLQQSLLPPELPDIPGVRVGAAYRPGTREMEVGGDFYDVFRIGRSAWGVIVGDVCGHGAEAAAVTAFARYTLRAAAAQTRTPARALRLLNDAMLRQDPGDVERRFVTVANARITPRSGAVGVSFAVGGHPLPVLRRADGSTSVVGRRGTLIGILPDIVVHDTDITLRRGDSLVIVTDGVLEARHGAEQFGEDRLLQLITGTQPTSPTALAQLIAHSATTHAQGAITDDIAVLVLQAP